MFGMYVPSGTHFYADSEGNGRGKTFSQVNEGGYYHVNRVNPGAEHPFHVAGKYGDLGWI